MSPPPAGRTLRLPSVCPGLRAAWVLISSPRTAPCPPSPPAHNTERLSNPTTTTTCSTTPSGPRQTPPPSSQPQAAWPATDRPATTEPPPRPTTATTTKPPCHMDSRSPLRPAPTGAPYPDQSASPSCRRPRCSPRPTVSLIFSFRAPPPLHRCPPLQSQPPTLPGWEGCPSWCLLRTRLDLWCNTGLSGESVLMRRTAERRLSICSFKRGQLVIFFKGNASTI